MANKAKHAFGSVDQVEQALADGKINAYDILFLGDDSENAQIGWIDKNGNPIILQAKTEVAEKIEEVVNEAVEASVEQKVQEALEGAFEIVEF